MTEAWDLLMQGEFLQAILKVYSYITNEPFFVFMMVAGFSLVVWSATDSALFAGVMFVLIMSTLVLSHLTQFHAVFGVIPTEVQWVVALVLVIIFGAALFYALTKKTG